MGERNLTAVEGRGCIEWLYSWIYILYIIKIHRYKKIKINRYMHLAYCKKADEGYILSSRFNFPVLLKKMTTHTDYDNMF